MFDNFKNLASLMSQAGQLKEKLADIQEQLAARTVEADAGAGAVRVVMNGKLEVQRVELDRAMIRTLAGEGDDADQQMIEELITAAMNAATAKVREMIQQEFAGLTGGLNLPGMDNLLG
jgi:nucleoid-associated protein EbfC